MRRFTVLLLVVSALLLSACADGGARTDGVLPSQAPGAANSDTRLGQYGVVLLFDQDGCKVYRFLDKYDYHYFTSCTGSVSTTRHTGGKAPVTVVDEIPTSVRP